MLKRFFIFIFFASLIFDAHAGLESGFKNPPASARPWVYWFWNNANVNSNGITADLEAMQRVGIGGVLIMDVFERFAPPRGTAEFMNPEWQRLFQFSVSEAARLGLEINMANGPGWTGSSGPWITPELSMQKLVWTNLSLTGPKNFSAILPRPNTTPRKGDSYDSHVDFTNFYADVALLAFPATTNGFVAHADVIDLSAKLKADGKLNWDVPPGDWIIERIGRTSTGSSTRPPVAGGNGLECDKLSAAAMDVHFTNMLERLVARAGPLVGKSFVATHIDSWEVGWQNWTPKFRGEFLKRRGYDPLSWLPCIAESISERVRTNNIAYNTNLYFCDFDSEEMSDRFRWDFNQTISELLAENYVGHLAKLAHEHGLRLSIEGYDLPFGDEGIYSASADEPMSEFWTSKAAWAKNFNERKGAQMASVAHTTGKNIVGAEAFTSDDHEKWMLYPATIKALGDFEFTRGINRLVIHRYAFQPYADRVPGATMGPWGLHYERTQTWWEMSKPWHEYLARCQFMLRQGKYVAELCYLRPQIPNQTYFTPNPPPPAGYRYDEISAEDLMQSMSVRNGQLILPDGMTYRVLILPPQTTMTPALAQKIKQLVAAGATVFGPRPKTSPSLENFPACDEEVAAIGNEVWGDCDGEKIFTHKFGKGAVNWGGSLANDVLADRQPPFVCDVPLNWIHRSTTNAEIYFLANGSTNPVTATCEFAVGKLKPEIWDPETGEISAPAKVNGARAGTSLTLHFAPGDSTFVVFRENSSAPKPVFADEAHPLLEITGPWQLNFPPHWGAPEKITLTNLVSWTEFPDEGVKHFSGTAIYRTTFELPKSKIGNKKAKIFLELGDVQVMARVKVNGKNCGIAWRPPFRLEVSDAVRTGENHLEISVANLWPNRLIGDAALPVTNRFTWSSWEPFKPNDPLLKSGLLGPVRLLAGITNREVIPARAQTRTVDTNTMQKIFDEVKTPFKYGVVLRGESTNEFVDCPSIFRRDGHWYMMYVAITNKVGYQTFLARSDDLLHWQKLGKILSFTATNDWDAWQEDGGIALADYHWNGSHELEKFDGRFWLSYIGGAKKGYETDPLSIGIAWTKNPARAQEWNRISENPVLSPRQNDVREFERKTLYKSTIIHDASQSLGFPFVLFGNGKYKNGYERIGMAVSRDMIHWRRYGENPVIANGEAKTNGISGDPQIVKIGDVWTMFYFGAGWQPHAFDTFACSYDLVHWTKWNGENLIQPSEPFDKTYAHKPWVLKWRGVVYHFYCAVGNEGRVIALATSKDLRR